MRARSCRARLLRLQCLLSKRGRQAGLARDPGAARRRYIPDTVDMNAQAAPKGRSSCC